MRFEGTPFVRFLGVVIFKAKAAPRDPGIGRYRGDIFANDWRP